MAMNPIRWFRSVTLVLVAVLPWQVSSAETMATLFKRVKDTVVIVKVTERDLTAAADRRLSTGTQGSGVLIDAKGMVLTAAHVVQTAETILVEFSDGTEVAARVAGSAPVADVALLKLEKVPPTAAVAILGDSMKIETGDEIFIVGAPLGITFTLTAGHISAKRESQHELGGLEKTELIQTDAVINFGNSGGPMFNMKGEVIGIVSHMISRTGGFEGMGFAVATETVQRLLLDRRSPWIGVEGYLLQDEMAGLFNLPQEMGLLVQRVAPNSPASSMGLKGGTVDSLIDGEPLKIGGDIILSFNGIPLSRANLSHIQEHLADIKPNRLVTVGALRAGKVVELNFTFPEE